MYMINNLHALILTNTSWKLCSFLHLTFSKILSSDLVMDVFYRLVKGTHPRPLSAHMETVYGGKILT